VDGLAIPPESSAAIFLIRPSKQARQCLFSILSVLSSDGTPRHEIHRGLFAAKSEPDMRAETLLRKLHFQNALSEDDFKAYLEKIGSDGSFPPAEIPSLLELIMQRMEKVSIEDIKAVSSLVGGDPLSTGNAGKIDENHAMRAIVSRLKK
jgi:hypothetical protein